MNLRQKGYLRDKIVLQAISEWGCLDTEQARVLFFPSVRVAQRRLAKLCAAGRIKRYRDTVEMPYAYFTDRYDYARVCINWARIWLIRRNPGAEIEYDYGTNSAQIANPVTKSIRTCAVLFNATRKTWVGEAVVVYDDLRFKPLPNCVQLSISDIRGAVRC